MTESFADRVVAWQRQFGRHGLPWQLDRSPYRVWLSEVMLQQTQVATAEGYFFRFVARFPCVEALASASLEDVLALWSGLGYYTRARNLWRCARQVVDGHGGRFPADLQSLLALPGIGRSTAGAILALAFGRSAAILDGNVKRVLARHAGLAERLDSSSGQKKAWALAESRLPQTPESIRPYTQGLMDLGSEVCKPRNPRCNACPVASDCVGRIAGPERYPIPAPRKVVQEQHWAMPYLWRADHKLGLLRRPARGIWAGLWCPQMITWADWNPIAEGLSGVSGVKVDGGYAPQVHLLTHRKLVLQVVHVCVEDGVPWEALAGLGLALPTQRQDWLDGPEWLVRGLPVPVRKHLEDRRGRSGPAPLQIALT